MSIHHNRNDVLSERFIEKCPKFATFWDEWKDSLNLVTFYDDGLFDVGFDHMNHSPESISQVNYLNELIRDLGLLEDTKIVPYVHNINVPDSRFDVAFADPHANHKTIKRYTILDLMEEHYER